MTVPLDLLVRVRDAIDTMGRYSDGRMKKHVRPLLAELTAQIEQQRGPLPHNLDNIGNVLVGCAGLLDNIKIEWSAEGCWSEWDQSVRDGVTRQLQKLEQQREGQGEPVAWNLICEGSPPYDRVRWANGEEICAIPGREFHDQISALVDAHNGMDNKEHAPPATPQDSVPAWAMELVAKWRALNKTPSDKVDDLWWRGHWNGLRECADELESRALALAQTKG